MEKYVDFLEKYLYDVTVLKGLNINENLNRTLNNETGDEIFDVIDESVDVINEANVQIMSTRASNLEAALEGFSSSEDEDDYDDDYDEPVKTKAVVKKKKNPRYIEQRPIGKKRKNKKSINK